MLTLEPFAKSMLILNVTQEHGKLPTMLTLEPFAKLMIFLNVIQKHVKASQNAHTGTKVIMVTVTPRLQ